MSLKYRTSGMSNSSWGSCQLAKQTMIWFRINLLQHTQPSNITTMTQRQVTLIRAHLATEYTWSSRSWRWHFAADPTLENNAQGLGEQMQNSNEVTQWCPQIYVSQTSKYQFPERHGKQYHAYGLRRCACCQTSAKNVDVGTSSDGIPRQDQVIMGRVHSPGSTID